MVTVTINLYRFGTDYPVPRALVWFGGRETTSDERGVAIFEDVDAGNYECYITHDVYQLEEAPRRALITVPDQPTYDVYLACRTIAPPPPIPKWVLEHPPLPPEKAEIVTPTLPWYAAWVTPIVEYLGTLTESATNYISPIFEPIGTFFLNLPEMAKSAWEGFIKGIPDVFNAFRDTGRRTAIDTIKGLAEGSPEWQKELADSLDPMIVNLLKGYSTALDVTTYEKSPLSGEDAVTALEDLKNRLLITAIANFGMHAAVEAGSLGQFEFMKDLDPLVTSKFGMDVLIQTATMKPIEKAVLIPAEHEFNTRYVPEIPPYTDLINMVVKEVIDLDEFNTQIAKLGYSSTWAKRIWDAHFIPPNYTQLLQAHYRGVIDKDELEKLSILVDLDPRYKAIWDAQIEVIPPYTELTNQLVKEVIDLPTYQKYLQWHGYDKVWAKRIWDAHFIPPSLGDILTAWRRGLIDESRVDDLMILVDLDPRFKDIFDTRKYVDPSLTMARYMFETQAIDIDGVKDIVLRQGYRPEDADAIVTWIQEFQERLWRRRYLVSLQTALTHDAVAQDVFTKAVLDAGYTEGVAEWMIKTADVRKMIMETKPKVAKARLLSTAELKKAYIIDKIDADGLRMGLLERGYEIDDVDLVIELIDHDKHFAEEGRKVVSLSVSQMLNAYRWKEMTRDELSMKLQLRGLAIDEVETLIKTKEKQWGLSE